MPGKSGKSSGDIRTTPAIRRAIQGSSESNRALSERYGLNPKTVAKWRGRQDVDDRKRGPREPQSTTLSTLEEALIALFRMHSRLPLDDCLAALRLIIPHLSRSALHRCLQRHGISRGSQRKGRKPHESRTDEDSIGCFDVSITRLPLPGCACNLFVAIDHSSKMAFAELHTDITAASLEAFLQALVATVPYRVQAIRTPPGVPCGGPPAAKSAAWREPAAAIQREPAASATHSDIRRIITQAEYWSDQQIERVEFTVTKAAHQVGVTGLTQLRQHLLDFIATLHLRCQLSFLNGLTPYEFVRTLRDAERGRSTRFKSTNAWEELPSDGDPDSEGRTTADKARRRPLSELATREAILEAAGGRLAYDGPEGLSLSEVARIAGVNRGTAYQHFETREKLIEATSKWVSEQLYRAIFGDPDKVRDRPVGQIDICDLTDRLAHFAMDNPELCRGWLLQVLSSPDPSSDLFWREYQGSTARFAETELAQPHIDTEVLSVIMLAGAFLWPVWARTKAGRNQSLKPHAARFAQESLRISMYGTLQQERYPAVAERLKRRAIVASPARRELQSAD